jgi:hypothetical protein
MMCYAFRTIGGRIEFDGITPDHGLNEQLVLDAHSIVGYYVGPFVWVDKDKPRPIQHLTLYLNGPRSAWVSFHVGELDDPLVRDTRLITDVINTLNNFIS